MTIRVVRSTNRLRLPFLAFVIIRAAGSRGNFKSVHEFHDPARGERNYDIETDCGSGRIVRMAVRRVLVPVMLVGSKMRGLRVTRGVRTNSRREDGMRKIKKQAPITKSLQKTGRAYFMSGATRH